MSIFASETQATVPIPFDPPHTITVRRLTGRECDAAREAHASGVATGGARVWATTFRRVLEGSISDKVTVQAAIADPLTGYDRYAVVAAGLVTWTYPRPVLNDDEHRAQRKASLDDLDDEAVDFIATEVLRVTKPGLFHATEEDAERAQKELSAAAPTA